MELKSPAGHSKALICLDQGGRLDEFVMNKVPIIKHTNAATYQKNYASAILFPFTNRVKNGTYTIQITN